ncbi:MAG TPA: glycosyltransferase [Terriglobia bacterium]|nr:glycosyltransferase [Terriglobia bacterium]
MVKTFPRLSETFILNEILGVEKLGVSLEIFAVRRPTEETAHPAVSRVRAPIHYLLGLGLRSPLRGALSVIGAHMFLLYTRRKQYLAAFRFFAKERAGVKWVDFIKAGYLARILLRAGFSHIHAHFANLPTSTAEVTSKLTGIPYSFTAHAKDIYLAPVDELRRKMSGATCVITCTAANQEYLRSIARAGTPVHLAHHGVDVVRFEPKGRTATAPQGGKPLILSVGRFCEKKGFPYLIEACRKLKDRGHDFDCRIVGYGPLEAELQTLIDHLGVGDCVSLRGKMTQDELVPVYEQARLFVLPCIITEAGDRDGIPNVFLEAMASELPVVSTSISGITELVDSGQNGFLVDPRDPVALADAVEKLLRDPALCRRFGARGRAKVLENFTLEASARRVRTLLLAAAGEALEAEPLPTREAVYV